MLKCALTGNIATGKTTVLGFFSRLGISTIDSDAIVAKLCKKAIVKKFLQKNFGSTRKKELAKIIFSSARKRALLESFLHPLVFAEIESKLKRFEKAKKKLVIVDVPLLFETKAQKNFDKVILVVASQPQQVFRLQKKGYSIEEAFARIKSQMPQHKKIMQADFVINNHGSLECTEKQVKAIKCKVKSLTPHRTVVRGSL